MNSVLITGATGAFGQAFVQHILKFRSPLRVVVYSRNEFNQHLMREKLANYESKMRFMIGDVRDRDRLRRAMEDVDVVVHAAALKRIEVGEYNPDEMVETNVEGSRNVVAAAMGAGVKKVIGLSSDKAFQPVNLYGATKLTMEKLFLGANNMRGWHGPIFSVCRYGNVWNSTGSVVPKWRSLIAQGALKVPVTDPECTRFYMTMQEAVDLVLHTEATMSGGELSIPNLPAYRLGDLADAMGVQPYITGLPKWEKMHESMTDNRSSDMARRMTMNELRAALNDI